MKSTSQAQTNSAPRCNVLYALIDEAHVHHVPVRQWFVEYPGGFATRPITQGTLVRLGVRIMEHAVALAAPLHLCLLAPGRPLFNTAAPAWRQQRLLASAPS